MTIPGDSSRVSPAWRRATLGLAGLLVLSWAVLGYAVLDTAISLDYCRVEQGHLRHDIRMLVAAASGRVSSSAFLDARSHLDPALPQRLHDDNTLDLRSIALRFGADGLLAGLVPEDP